MIEQAEFRVSDNYSRTRTRTITMWSYDIFCMLISFSVCTVLILKCFS